MILLLLLRKHLITTIELRFKCAILQRHKINKVRQMKEINITTTSMSLTVGDFRGNRQKIIKAITEAKSMDSSLVVTPELSITGYGMEDFFTYPETIEKAKSSLMEIVKSMPYGIIALVGLPLLHEGRLYNAVATIEKDRVLGLTFKRNLASNGIHYEQRWFTPWQSEENCFIDIGMDEPVLSGSPIIEFGGFRLGVEICEDGWVSNRIAQKYFERNVDIIANPSASHFATGKFETRKRLVQDSSRAYGVVYVYSNITGCESGRAIYDGGSMIYSNGEEIATGERFHFSDIETLTRTIASDANQAVRMQTSQRYSENTQDFSPIATSKSPYPVSVETYHKPTPTSDKGEWELGVLSESHTYEFNEIARALALALADWSHKTQCNGFTLSLSGGADSSLVACLVHLSALLELSEFINKGMPLENSRVSRFIDFDDFDQSSLGNATLLTQHVMKKYLITAYQPSDNSGDVTQEAAKELAKELNANHFVLNVGKIISEYEKEFNRAFDVTLNWEEHDIPKQNIQARARSPMIWLPANFNNSLLLTTSNLSEASVGYVTQDGDSSGVLAPISGVTKTKVRAILRFLEETGIPIGGKDNFCYKSLRKVNKQAPTAELRPTEQTDEDDLMPFEVLDFILEKSMQCNFNPLSVVKLLEREFSNEKKSILADYVLKFYRHFFRNQWKRDRQAPGFHVMQGSLDPKTYKRIPLLCKMYEEELEEVEALTKKI